MLCLRQLQDRKQRKKKGKKEGENKKRSSKEMGKYKNGRRIAVQSGRELFERVENLVRGGAIPKPAWFDAMKFCPPPKIPFA
jgi:ribosomal protein S25